MNIDTVLLIDDNAEYKKVVAKALESLTSWQILTGSNGQEALQILRLQQPDVILMDVSMPEMDGLEAIEKIRQDRELSDIPIILVTAKVLEEEMEHYATLGLAGIVSKPFDPLELHKRVEEMVSDWRS
ncbi:MAG: response regulator [Cyanobacteria bacterium SZAS LIN-3]|nr:response regulator [Cyanobacteria bacterium SZAS LIN-3]